MVHRGQLNSTTHLPRVTCHFPLYGDAIGRAHRPITGKPARASALVSYFALSALRQVMLNLTL